MMISSQLYSNITIYRFSETYLSTPKSSLEEEIIVQNEEHASKYETITFSIQG